MSDSDDNVKLCCGMFILLVAGSVMFGYGIFHIIETSKIGNDYVDMTCSGTHIHGFTIETTRAGKARGSFVTCNASFDGTCSEPLFEITIFYPSPTKYTYGGEYTTATTEISNWYNALTNSKSFTAYVKENENTHISTSFIGVTVIKNSIIGWQLLAGFGGFFLAMFLIYVIMGSVIYCLE